MKRYVFGNASARNYLIQLVDDHDCDLLEREISAIRAKTEEDFFLIALKVENWNDDLTPWKAPAVFGKEDFGGCAERTLAELRQVCTDQEKRYYIGGYSLAGLFALWAAYQTDIFRGVAAASPSVWFQGFTDYIKEHEIQTEAVYLSLGDKEPKAKNPLMASVGDRIQTVYDDLKAHNIRCVFEWNQGNHFKDSDIRTANAFVWLLQESTRSSS